MLFLIACGTRPVTAPVNPTIEMEPMLITEQGGIQVDVLFEEGVGALNGQLFDQCIERFSTLVKFKDHIYLHPAYYNLGLCYEFVQKHVEAEQAFREYIKLSTAPENILDGKVRLGVQLVKNKKADEALALYEDILLKNTLKPMDRAECHLRKAMAYLVKEDFSRADNELSVAISQTNGLFPNGYQQNELIAEVFYQKGEVFRLLSAKVALKLPVEKMRRALNDKIRYFKKAVSHYVSCINVHQSYWATAAGFQLAKQHEDIYYQITNAEHPADFDEETIVLYRHQLKKKIFPILQESISIYQKNAELGQRIGASNEWIKATDQKLNELKQMIGKVQEEINQDPLVLYEKQKANTVTQEAKVDDPTTNAQEKGNDRKNSQEKVDALGIQGM